MKPVIGIIPLFDDEKQSLWMLPGYMNVIEKAGGLPIMLPLTVDNEEIIEAYNLCDGILFTGGQDVNPAVYGQKKRDTCGQVCEERDYMEGVILNKCIEEEKPIFGICRGIQFINSFLGGTLYQDLPTEYKSDIEHHMSPPYDMPAHRVTVFAKTRLAEIIGEGFHEVNSYHHQAIKELSSKVEKMAVSEDGLVEAIGIKNHRFALAVQWHPEFSYTHNEESMKLIEAFINECK